MKEQTDCETLQTDKRNLSHVSVLHSTRENNELSPETLPAISSGRKILFLEIIPQFDNMSCKMPILVNILRMHCIIYMKNKKLLCRKTQVTYDIQNIFKWIW